MICLDILTEVKYNRHRGLTKVNEPHRYRAA
nr:MAG TPA: hypothetical protein [Caudoviricetes sp.]